MKKLTDIRVINWHGFYDEEIRVDGSILIAGDNGSGKSTLIDAIYYVLSGGDSGKFNSAANERTDRTVETYMRGRTGESSNPFLRTDKNIVSHICLQFFDDVTAETFLLGVVLEIQDGIRDVLKTFYHVPSTSLDDSLFKDDEGRILNFRLMEEKKGDGYFHVLGDSQKKIRQALYGEILDIDGKKYLDLLPKAVSFKPIDDVHEFVYRFLMPEKNVDITSMRTVISSLNELSKTVKDQEAKKEALKLIVDKGSLYNENKRKASLYQALALNLASSGIDQEKERLSIEIGELESHLKSLEGERDSLTEKQGRLSGEINSLERDESYVEMRGIDLDIAQAERKKKEAEDALRNFEGRISKEAGIMSALSLGDGLSEIAARHDFRSLRAYLSAYSSSLRKKKESLSEALSELRTSLGEDRKEAARLEAEQRSLKEGRAVYPSALNSLRKLVIDAVKEETGDTIDPRPFCELLDFEEENAEYRTAVESYLAERRFDLFVEEEYHAIAVKALENSRDRLGIANIGIVDLAHLEEVEPIENSLASKVKALTYDAGNYLNLLLGKVICLESVEEAKNVETGITKDAILYEDKATRQKPLLGTTPYIGVSSRAIRLAEVEEELRGLQSDIATSEEEVRSTRRLLDMADSSNLSRILEEEDVYRRYDDAAAAHASLINRKAILESGDGDLTRRGAELAELRKELAATSASISDINNRIKDVSGKIGADKTRLSTLDEDVGKKEEEFERLLKESGISNAFESFKEDKDMAAEEAERQVDILSRENGRLEKELRSLMGGYARRFSFDETSDIDALPAYMEEYDKIAHHFLVENVDRLERQKKQASEAFQNDYIAKIRESIEEEKKHIKKLNDILAGRPFGSEGDVYEFLVGPSKDSNFRPYYEIFTSKQDYAQETLFTETLSSQNEALMSSLYDRFTSEDADEKLLAAFTDYRNFMDYDIKIRDKHGKVYRFSEISKSKSGGETQTPFYVIIAASFDQLCRTSYSRTSPGCLVMFDEAFEKMDQSHVESMMRYFRELSIQPILAVPGNQAKSIAPYVTTRVALVKQNGRVIASPIIKTVVD